MKIHYFLLISFTLLISNLYSQENNKSVDFSVCPGLNISKLKTDSTGMANIAYPQIGFLVSKNIRKAFSVNGGMNYSLVGANHNSPKYKFMNSYIDFLVSSQYTLNNFLKFQIGGQYSYLLKSQLIIPNYLMSDKTKRITLNEKYSNQFNLFLSAGLYLQKNVSLNFKYCLPLKSNEYNSFQISLAIIIQKDNFKKKDSLTVQNLYGIEYEFENKSYTENDGIIYPSIVSKPPQFREGLASMNQYFENNVRVFPRDYETFGDREIDILYKITIDTLGNVTASNLEEIYSTSQGTGFQAGHLPDEIKKVIDAMPAWKPALIDGKPAEISFYLPFCFKLDLNKIVMVPSKYKFSFHNRNK